MIKIILSWVVILLVAIFCVWQTCFAELYVVVDKTTKEIITVSEKNDTILGTNQELKIMSGSLADFTDENPTNYKLTSSNKFIKNIDKIDKQEQERIKQEKSIAEKKALKEKLKTISLEKTVGTDGLPEVGKKLDKVIDVMNDLLKVQE